MAPGHVSILNRLVATLTADEQAQLAGLLAKLTDGIASVETGEASAAAV